MQPISSFNPNLGTAILLVGSAGSGKTVLSCRLFPKVYIFVADPNLESAKRYLTEKSELQNIVGYDMAQIDEAKKVVAPLARFDRMLKCISAVEKDSAIETIVLDSASFIEDVIKAKICSATDDTKIKLDGFKQWGDLIITWKSIISQLRMTGKKLVMTAHETKGKDESDGMYKYEIALDGKSATMLPSLFSDVWRTYVKEPPLPGNPHLWRVQTLASTKHEHLKNTYGFAADMLADDVVKAIRK